MAGKIQGKFASGVLRERLGINESDRKLLNVMDEMSPSNNSVIYVTPSIFNRPVPTLKQIADKVGKSKKQVWGQLNKIRKTWDVPTADKLPTSMGVFDKEDALVNALTNQHRLRWDDNRGDYRVTKFHLMSAEMGCGQLYTNNRAFEGENIFRKAIGLDDKLNSVHFQGGIMPEMIQIFGKAKNQRALMTGLNKTGTVDNGEELKKVKQILALGDHELTPKDMDNLQNYVINTLGSLDEAAKSVAHEMLPLVENVPEHTPVHMYYSYNDVANMSEIEDTLNVSLRKIHAKMASDTKKLPGWREEHEGLRDDLGKSLIDKLVLERVYFHVNKERSKAGDDFKDRGAKFGEVVDSAIHRKDGKETQLFQKFKDRVRKEYKSITGKSISDGAAEEQFKNEFYGVVNQIYNEHVTFGHLQKAHEKEQEKFGKTYKDISSLEDKINEAEKFENALMVEAEGPAHFTGHIAITQTESKALQMVKKGDYKRYYTDILIPELKKLSGKDLNIKLHTDSIINVNVPDPQDLIEGRELTDDSPIGTTITSFPRTNEQRSNEPLLNSAAELQGFHAGEVSERIKKGKSKPKTVGEFSKRDFASSDVYWTSWGADGFMQQPRLTIGDTTVRGEYRVKPEIANYMKLPTRHDTSKLGELMVKGNKGTWHAKRMAKGGCTTGNVIYIEHADQSFQPLFIDDMVYEKIADEYGRKYSALENALGRARSKLGQARSKEDKARCGDRVSKINAKIADFNEQIKPKLYNILLENDLHLGASSVPGRPTVMDRIQSSQLAAVQSYGLDGLQFGIMTEVLNGEQAWRSYDSKREGPEGSHRTNEQVMRDMSLIRGKMHELGFGESEIVEHTEAFMSEFLESRSQFLPEQQIALARSNVIPINSELMDNGMQLYVGSGNHWMSKKENISEGDILCNLFNQEYRDQGKLIKSAATTGQAYTYETINMPGVDGKTIPAVVSHKFPSGKTEIGPIPTHLVKTRTHASYGWAADRHHGGLYAEKGKMGALDMGKQPTIVYREMIGKVSSLGGSMVTQYGANGEQIVGARYFVDPVVDGVCGWDHRAGVLKESRSFLEESVKDTSLAMEKKRFDYARRQSTDKFKSVEKYLAKE
ncbi:hypothetical protein HNV12_00030 [Methanococcoides sp. SA1]|nr:hypothetical protein [Methanococcoides sp. SA1]